jgi:penicillin amidase
MPYVKAPSFSSAMYGWGYVTAEDRLFQMAFKRLAGQGKLSKYLGKKALNTDKFFR